MASRIVTESNGPLWRYLALAQYRAGDVGDAVESLQKSMALRRDGDALDWLLLAMCSAKSGRDEEARRWYVQAEHAIANRTPIVYGEIGVLGFRRIRAEARAILEPASIKPPPVGSIQSAGLQGGSKK